MEPCRLSIELQSIFRVHENLSAAPCVCICVGLCILYHCAHLHACLPACCIAFLHYCGWRTTVCMPLPQQPMICCHVTLRLACADVPVLGPIPLGSFAPRIPSIPLGQLPQIGALALTLAILGAIDSLLTSLIADSLTATFHDSDRELIGQV